MTEYLSMIMSERDFGRMLQERHTKARDPGTTVSAQTHELKFGKSRMSVRQAGGYMMGLQLCSPESGKPVDVSFRFGNGNLPVLFAGRLALTHQPNRGSGKPLSWPEWVDWTPARRVIEYEDSNALYLSSETPETLVRCMRKFFLSRSSLMTTTTLNTVRPLDYSIAHYDLYPFRNGYLGDIKYNGLPLSEVFDHDVVRHINEGHAWSMPEFDGNALIEFPEGNNIFINATANLDHTSNLIPGLVISRRIDHFNRAPYPFVAFSPTLGYEKTMTFRNAYEHSGIGPHTAELQVVTGLAPAS